MNARLPLFLVGVLLLQSLLPAMRAADSGGAEDDRMRAALRDTMAQLQNTQTQLAALQASEASSAEGKKALTDKYEALKKQTAFERSLTDRTVKGLTTQLAEQQTLAANLQDALDKERAARASAGQAAQAAQEQAAKLSNQNIVLQRQVADCQGKNLALFLLGNEILSRYEDFSLGNALSAKEPFVGKTRARLENLVQDYQDKLADQRAK